MYITYPVISTSRITIPSTIVVPKNTKTFGNYALEITLQNVNKKKSYSNKKL